LSTSLYIELIKEWREAERRFSRRLELQSNAM